MHVSVKLPKWRIRKNTYCDLYASPEIFCVESYLCQRAQKRDSRHLFLARATGFITTALVVLVVNYPFSKVLSIVHSKCTWDGSHSPQTFRENVVQEYYGEMHEPKPISTPI